MLTRAIAPPPDSYFTPSPADIQTAQATLSARTHALTDRPLELKAVREAREKAKRDRWPNVRGSMHHREVTTADRARSADHDPHPLPRSHAAGEDLSVNEQDQGGVRVRARAAEGRCEAYQVHIMCVVDDGSRERAR